MFNIAQSCPEHNRTAASACVAPDAPASENGEEEAPPSDTPQQPAAEANQDNATSPAKQASPLERFNAQYAVVNLNGRTLVLDEDNRTYHTFEDFRKLHNHRQISVQEKQTGTNKPSTTIKKVPIGSWWLSHPHRRQYDRVIFDPSTTNLPANTYNLWQGFAVQPQEGACHGFINHLIENVCRGDIQLAIWLVAWLAQLVQQPATRPGTALVLRGDKGTGKGFFVHTIGKLLGRHYLYVTQQRQLTGNFNAHLQDCLLLFLDEATWLDNPQAEGVLKGLITDPYLMIEPKGVNPYQAPNYLHLVLASNADWIVPASWDERRYAVLEVGDGRKQNHAYFNRLQAELDNGGYAALLNFLLHFSLDETKAEDIDPAVIPQTTALMDQKLQSLPPVEMWWLSRLQRGAQTDAFDHWEAWLATYELYNDFVGFHQQKGKKPNMANNIFASKLRDIVPGLTPQKLSLDGKRTPGYTFPPLVECRAAFERRLGALLPWPPDEEEESGKEESPAATLP